MPQDARSCSPAVWTAAALTFADGGRRISAGGLAVAQDWQTLAEWCLIAPALAVCGLVVTSPSADCLEMAMRKASVQLHPGCGFRLAAGGF